MKSPAHSDETRGESKESEGESLEFGGIVYERKFTLAQLTLKLYFKLKNIIF